MTPPMKRLDVGVLGGGLIVQLEHLPNLLNLPEHFRVVGVAEPSAKVRAHLERRWGVATFAAAEELLDRPLDAVLIATPDSYHADLAVAALDRGLHVFSEKPLCYALEDATRVAAARDRAGRVVQIGYMKRFDPSWRLLAELVGELGGRLRLISVEVNDPDSWPYVAHRDYVAGDDVPTGLIEESGRRRAEQIARSLGRTPSASEIKGFAGPYSSSVVHDVNLVHGLLDAMRVSTGEVTGAAIFAGSTGAEGTVRLTPGDGLWTVFHIAVPKLADYVERVSLYFDDRIYVLTFPSPYLNHHPTTLIEKRSEGHHARTILHRASYEEAFVEELKGWWRAIVEGAAVVNPVEDARRDMALLVAFARRAMASTAQGGA
jgi:predicted dehydrogenase